MPKRTSRICRRLSFATLVLVLISFVSRSAMTQENKTVTLELDHVSVCGSNLDTLRQIFTDVGMTPDLGGPHGNGITQMAIIGFDDASYIELIAPIKAGEAAGSEWAKFMSEDAVTCAWAVGTNVLLQDVDRLKKAGIAVKAPERGSRKRPDGMSIEWMTADVGSGTPGSTLPFMIEDQTPRAWRVQTSASVQGAPVSGVENVVLGVNNLDAAIALFRKAYGWAEPLLENAERLRQTRVLPRRTRDSGRSYGRRMALRAAGEVRRVSGRLPARHARLRGSHQEVQALRGQTWFGQKVAGSTRAG